MAPTADLSPARRRVAERLKVAGAQTTAQLAEALDLTRAAVGQHLQALEEGGLVASAPLPAAGRGRPSHAWSLTAAAGPLFPDRHGELTVGLIAAIRKAVGDTGLDAVIHERGEAQKRQYDELMPDSGKGLGARVRALAKQRSREGYMAEVRREKDGSYLLFEHHCPICEAASACTGLCAVELAVFKHALGDEAEVERVAHLLSGEERCVYRIRDGRA